MLGRAGDAAEFVRHRRLYPQKAASSDPGRIRSAVDLWRIADRTSRAFSSRARISLGAARLKIIDLDARRSAHDVAQDGDTVIAFNGEIYNHLELRRELEARGHRFRSAPTPKRVLEAFREWDTDCFSRLRGMFAVALWTESSQRLVLARDRMGIKPLYLARRGEDLYFGSELKAIFVHPEIERKLSLDGLDCYLALNYVPEPWTLVEGIEKLRPGHWLEWSDGKVRVEAYWTSACGDRNAHESLSRRPRRARSLLKQSVREHWSRTCRWACGSAAASIPRRCCIMPRRRPARA